MCGHSVTMSELLEVRRQQTTIVQMNLPSLIHVRNGDDFAIRRTESRLTPIRCQQEPFTGGDFNRDSFEDIERLRLLSREGAQLAAFIPNRKAVRFDLHHLDRFVFLDSFHFPMESQQLTRIKIAHVLFLCSGPIQRNVSCDDNAPFQFALSLSIRANRGRHMIDFIVRGADHEHIVFMGFGISIRRSDGLSAFGPPDFTHCSHGLEPLETAL